MYNINAKTIYVYDVSQNIFKYEFKYQSQHIYRELGKIVAILVNNCEHIRMNRFLISCKIFIVCKHVQYLKLISIEEFTPFQKIKENEPAII